MGSSAPENREPKRREHPHKRILVVYPPAVLRIRTPYNAQTIIRNGPSSQAKRDITTSQSQMTVIIELDSTCYFVQGNQRHQQP